MPDSNEDGALHAGESGSTRESDSVSEMNYAGCGVDGSRQIGGSVGGRSNTYTSRYTSENGVFRTQVGRNRALPKKEGQDRSQERR